MPSRELPRNCQEACGPLPKPDAKGIEPALGPLLGPTLAAKGIDSACGAWFEPDTKEIKSAQAESKSILGLARLLALLCSKDPTSAKKIYLHEYDTLLPEETGMVSDPYPSCPP